MHQEPEYIGYVITRNGVPSLVFNTGVLVQADADLRLVGWHAFCNRHQIFANAAPDLCRQVIQHLKKPAHMAPVLQAVIQAADFYEEDSALDSYSRDGSGSDADDHRPAPRGSRPLDEQRLVIMDTPRDDLFVPSPIFMFQGPLYFPRAAGFSPSFDEAFARRTVGVFDGAGQPVGARKITTAGDAFVHFS